MITNKRLNKLKKELILSDYTCIIANDKEIIYKSNDKGILPLIKYLDSACNDNNLYIADKVIGRAAALLCIKAKIKYLYASTISTPAIKILRANHIFYQFDKETPFIKNRQKNGKCPMETISKGITSPDIMHNKIIEWLKSH